MLFNSYKDLKGYQWSKDVVEERFLANKYIKLECKRYIDRLEKLQHEDSFEFFFNLDEANIVFGLVSLMIFPTGFFAGKNISLERLEGFQAMVIENIFCWQSKKLNEYGARQRLIEEVYLEIGRKSGQEICHLV